ncbi:MAG: winged helix-turn-helix transcriptional regulator, partial [Desulfobacterales bacterium]|nr:winged helix-turn-helix transcriptional regulator [Desulfobacterales bacterium]
GVPAPEINYEFAGLMITFQAKGADVSGKTTRKTTQKTTRKILSILKENPSASRKEIALILGDITEDGVKYQLYKMKKERILERIGPAKGGYWKIIKDTILPSATKPRMNSDLLPATTTKAGAQFLANQLNRPASGFRRND